MLLTDVVHDVEVTDVTVGTAYETAKYLGETRPLQVMTNGSNVPVVDGNKHLTVFVATYEGSVHCELLRRTEQPNV